MSWMKVLCDTYDNLSKADVNDNEEVKKLLPIAHSTQKAHITVTIDTDGEFIRAEFVADVLGKDKNLSETLMPVTEKSASRSSGSAPHPLCDKLKYLAGDYEKYCDEKNDIFYDNYIEQLEDWAGSSYSTPKVKAILAYIKKGTLIYDLINNGIFSVGENGLLTDRWENADVKLSVGNQQEAFVRFSVIGDTEYINVWEDRFLQNQYIGYYLDKLNKTNKTEFCCICGEEKACSENHPQKIRHSGDKAKLISANDTSGFTYRGRFKTSSEAVSISYEASQKAHNALKFLIQKQGTRIGEKFFLLWGSKDEDMPLLTDDTFSFWDDDDTSDFAYTKEDCAEKFNLAISGYRNNIDYESQYAIIGLDAATTGRMSVLYYREYQGEQVNDLFDNIERWHTTASWHHSYKFRNKKKVSFYGAPAPYDIALCAFGKEESDFLGGDDKIIAKASERILYCISDGARIPRDIVNILIRKAFSPQNYSNRNNWYKVLSVACSMYRKYLNDYKERDVSMSIDKNNKDIAYNCGRLLAVADAIEEYAIYDAGGKSASRTTNAMRFFSRFAQYPCSAWGEIKKRIIPYQNKLGDKCKYYNTLMAEISADIDAEEFKSIRHLSGEMALGFDAQRNEFIQNRIKNSKNNTTNEEEK